MQQAIRDVLAAHARLKGDAHTIDAAADLYQAGMTSHASVAVMLALEDNFDVEFPDAMLTREGFASIVAIESAISQLLTEAEAV